MTALLLAALLANTNPAPISTDLVFEITAYSNACSGCSGITASGLRPRPGMVACAPKWDFGTRFHIPGVGTVVCEDRGSAIRGRRLDLFLPSRAQAVRWGRRTLRVRVLAHSGGPGRPNEPRKGVGAPSGVSSPYGQAGER